MFRFIWFLRGYACLEICGASPGWALNCLTAAGVAFWNIQWLDTLTVRISVPLHHVNKAIASAEKAMCDCRLTQTLGLPKYLKRLRARPVLIGMILLSVLGVALLQQFVFFYEVVGNETVPSELILRQLQDVGVGFGSFGPSIHPQQVKDHLLSALPQLEWVTVTQTGCRGRVEVRERRETPDTQSRKGYANVIATRGGVITDQSIFSGQAQFHIGDTVSKGDVLVSGIVDLERIYVLKNASAEIFARTWRNSEVIIPSTYTEKTAITHNRYAIWLVVGRSRIKIFGNSGISDVSCDKMRKTRTLCLPGGLELPVRLQIETVRHYNRAERILQKKAAGDILSAYAEHRAAEQMQAGQILHKRFSVSQENRRYKLACTLECHEMIAKAVPGQWKNEDWDND